jgi:uncharacterized protein (DUF427 family)
VPYYPAYYFPRDDVDMTLLHRTDDLRRSPSRGSASLFNLKMDDLERIDAAWSYEAWPILQLQGLIRFEWGDG